MAKPTTAEALEFAAKVARECLVSTTLTTSMGQPANIVDAARDMSRGLFSVADALTRLAEAIEKKA